MHHVYLGCIQLKLLRPWVITIYTGYISCRRIMYNLCRIYYEALSKLSVCRYIAMQETGTVYSRLGKYFQGFILTLVSQMSCISIYVAL